MKRTIIFAVIAIVLASCTTRSNKQVSNVEEQMIAVDATADALQDSAYLLALQPIREQLNQELDVVIAYAPEALTVNKPECTMLNWASDALQDMAIEIGMKSDFAVVNIGGMRCEWTAGDITRRSIFELMPFDNELVVLTLSGQDILDLCDIFAQQGGQGVSRELRMQIRNGKAENVVLNHKPIVADAIYYVATSDYLSTGADHFTPLTRYQDMQKSNLKIRDLYMQYAIERKVVESAIDGRMKKL